MALPRSSLVGRALGGPPPGRGEARVKPCAAAEGRAAGPIDWRALAFLPFAPCTGEGPGLGLEGGLRDIVGVVCVKKEKKPNRIKQEKTRILVLVFF